ncbi:MAG: hypothetical protein ACYDDF_08895 [Thermoplasmatota archaeon]
MGDVARMVEPQFAESAFATLATNEIIDRARRQMLSAPYHPSTNVEAAEPFDVRFRFRGLSLFLQYKLSHYLTRASASEWQDFQRRYFRFGVYRPMESPQHNLLVRLGQLRTHVFYCAPAFHTLPELDSHFLGSQIIDNSVAIPSANLPMIAPGDRVRHKIAFARRSPMFQWGFYSERQTFGEEKSASDTIAAIFSALAESPERMGAIIDIEYLNGLYTEISNLVPEGQRALIPRTDPRDSRDERAVARAIQLLSLTRLGAEWVLVGRWAEDRKHSS